TIVHPDGGTLNTNETISIDWGGGVIQNGLHPNSDGTFSFLHTYSNSGPETVTLTITDQFSGQVTKSTITSDKGTGSFPAGIAGSPINLALGDLSGSGAAVTYTFSGVPADWSLNRGTNNGDGIWTVSTTDPS